MQFRRGFNFIGNVLFISVTDRFVIFIIVLYNICVIFICLKSLKIKKKLRNYSKASNHEISGCQEKKS